MAEYHVSAGFFGGIYAGILKHTLPGMPREWKDKSDVTEEALSAVRDYMVSNCLEKEGRQTGGYEWTRKDGKKVLLIVKVVDADA